jgi:DNA-binding NarL/FixJ family response regulator
MAQPATIRVIVTDDHRLFRTGIKNSLGNREDIRVIGEAENGAQLLQLLETLQADVITLNLQMPVLNGFETLPLLRERYPHLKVLIISMINNHGIIRKAIELGAHGYLTKEAGREDIYAAVKSLHKNWMYINRTVAEALVHTENELRPVVPPQMSEKEKRFLGLLSVGHTEDQLSRMLNLNPRTIMGIIDKLIKINGVQNKEELIKLNSKQRV